MRSGSAVVENDEWKKTYHIYVEEYVLSYLRRESDSLELTEIYFYGSRRENGKKFYVYGAGRSKGIAAFAEYEPLSELVCRLTQAGPVFLVREPDGECRAAGFQVFYDNNEAMQNYLLEWTGSTSKNRIAEKQNVQETLPASARSTELPKEEKKRTPHGAMSVQLCLILVLLVAIVITSTDSYEKMEELNRSAKEVFFAIENQEAEGTARDAGEQEIVVERDIKASRETEQEGGAAEKPAENTDFDGTADGPAQDTDTNAIDSVTEESAEKEKQEEGVLKPAQEPSDGTDGQVPAEEKEESRQEETASADEGKEDQTETAEQSEEDNEEAFSRSITRYYEVEQGDTLYTISQKIYGDISRVEKICEVNDISDPDKIRSGQRIILP